MADWQREELSSGQPEHDPRRAGLSGGEAEALLRGLAGQASGARAARPRDVPAEGEAGTPEDRLRKAEARYRTLVEQVPAVTFLAALDEGVNELYVSPHIETLLGYSQQEWLADPVLWYTRLHPDDRERWHREFARTCAAGEPFRSDYRFLSRDGRVVWVHGEAQVVRDEHGRPLFLQGLAYDITVSKEAEQTLRQARDKLDEANRALLAEVAERRQAEQALARSEAMLHGLFEHAPDAIAVVDAAGRLVRVNEQVMTLFGYSREELLGQPVEVLVPERYRDRHVHHRQGFVGRPRTRAMGTSRELFGRRKDGSEFPVQVSLGPLRTAEGLFALSIIRDVTEHRKLEEQFRQAQKMEAVGRLAAGVAHDFNNLLTVILGCGELALTGLLPESQTTALVREMMAAGERAAGLTRQLLTFSRRQVLSPEVLDLNALVVDMEKMLRRLIGEDILLEHLPGLDLRPVQADRGHIEQVLLNLAVNARDAMPGGGRLTITTGNVVLDPGQVLPRPGMPPGAYVMVRVADTGCGMDTDTLDHLFEPFFTTKGVGKGTGLGLATVYGIVQQSGGFIDVESKPGQGAAFTLFLPSTEVPAANGVPEGPSRDLPLGTEIVLLVEDEGMVRNMTREVLEQCGYTVLEACQGGEALAVAGGHAGPLHLLLTDVVMPEVGGPELARRLATLRPGLKVLFMTGYTDDRALLEDLSHDEAHVLHKPFSLAALAQKVRQVLDE